VLLAQTYALELPIDAKGTCRKRMPQATKTALAMVAGIGPCTASPQPLLGWPDWSISTTSISGISPKRRIG